MHFNLTKGFNEIKHKNDESIFSEIDLYDMELHPHTAVTDTPKTAKISRKWKILAYFINWMDACKNIYTFRVRNNKIEMQNLWWFVLFNSFMISPLKFTRINFSTKKTNASWHSGFDKGVRGGPT